MDRGNLLLDTASALQPYTPVLSLEPRLLCRECDARGKAVVSIRWAA
jgi:hypothetical protein